MRIRPIIAIVALLLPVGLSAQRIPLIGRRGPARPAPLPPQPAPIAKELAYKRMPLSVESYPLITYTQSPGFTNDGIVAGWTSLGMGTRADYRLTRHVSATLDLTSSLLGGPALIQTAELGTRLHPERTENKVHPFADLRVGYISAYNRSPGIFIDDGFGSVVTQGGAGSRYSRGFGGVAGAGMEVDLTRSWSLTTGGSVMRNRMTTHSLQSVELNNRHYALTSYRYTLGVRYNWVRVIRPTATEVR